MIRLPTPAQLARRRGLPADRIDYRGMRAWCEATCRKGWREDPTTAEGTVFRFEDRAEAMAFTLHWFPFKCG
jgi:hypothetical protein